VRGLLSCSFLFANLSGTGSTEPLGNCVMGFRTLNSDVVLGSVRKHRSLLHEIVRMKRSGHTTLQSSKGEGREWRCIINT